MLNILIKSIYAGIMIGIGGIVYLSLDNPIIGAFLFSFGLLTIVTQGFYLFTGKVGFVNNFQTIKELPIILIGNFIGTKITALLANIYMPNFKDKVITICNSKMSIDLLSVFALSIFCGIMMFLAIKNYKVNNNLLFIILPVMIFILSGFEHSIADMFYFNVANKLDFNSLKFLFVVICGNSIGSLLFNSCLQIKIINKEI